MIFIPALLDYSTCFGCILHPSSGVQKLYMQPLAHIQLLNSWWWVQEAPETSRVVKKRSNKGHCPAASCWFIKYWYVMHGTMNLYNQVMAKNQTCLCTRHEGRWRTESITPHILLNLSFRWGEWSVSRSSHYTSEESGSETHRTGGSVYPTAGPVPLAKREISSPLDAQPVA